MMERLAAFIFGGCVMTFGAGAVIAQDYPNKPIHIVTGSTGGAVDFTARLIAQEIAKPLGQPVLVDNRGGGGGAVAIGSAAKAPPDGYTILAYSSAVWIVPLLRQNASWDPIRDFSPITLANRTPNIVVVHPSLPVKTVKELIALAKARPGELNYASVGSGSGAHLAAELFKSMAGVNMVHVPYKGTAPGLTDLIGGRVEVMFAIAGMAMPHVKSLRLRALAVTSAQPSALAPGVPTVAASGLPRYESIQMFGIYAPATTPAKIIGRLNREMIRVLHRADIKEKFLNTGLEVVGTSPTESLAAIKSDMARMAKVIKEAGIRAE